MTVVSCASAPWRYSPSRFANCRHVRRRTRSCSRHWHLFTFAAVQRVSEHVHDHLITTPVFVSLFETPTTSAVQHLTSIRCLDAVASTPAPADGALAHIITTFFKRARGRFVKHARACDSCVHTTQINWTLGSTALGFGPGLPSVQTC